MELHRVYFWTATIHHWYQLLRSEENKQLILESLQFLAEKDLVKIYAFVIMPNHVHFLWQQNKFNGKELPSTSFLKFTAHRLLKRLQQCGQSDVYRVREPNREHRIWQRDPLAMEVFSMKFARQKLNYIHRNPIQPRWMLVDHEWDYFFSSIRYYECDVDDFGFLNNVFAKFHGD